MGSLAVQLSMTIPRRPATAVVVVALSILIAVWTPALTAAEDNIIGFATTLLLGNVTSAAAASAAADKYLGNKINSAKELDIAVTRWRQNRSFAFEKWGHIAKCVAMILIWACNVRGYAHVTCSYLHANIVHFGFPPKFRRWDVSRVTTLEELFSNDYDFNDDISQWDTKRVTSMNATFRRAHEFNQDLSKWQTSKVTSFRNAFFQAWVK
jgi:surface protein